MMLEKEILIKAQDGKYAVGAFNFSTIEILNGILDAATLLKSPVIVSTSESEMRHIRACNAVAIVNAFIRQTDIPVVLHLDHGKSMESVREAIDAGYHSVHIDGSALSFIDNRNLTKEIVDFAHAREVSVEGELGHIKGSSKMHDSDIDPDTSVFTNPDQAREFIEFTGIDSLAVSIGSMHGIYASEPRLDIELLGRIIEQTNIPLVLHGGSGIPPEQIREAISHGIAKINVNTENRIAYSQAVKEILKNNPEEIVPYNLNQNCSEAVKAVTMKKIALFGSGNAS